MLWRPGLYFCGVDGKNGRRGVWSWVLPSLSLAAQFSLATTSPKLAECAWVSLSPWNRHSPVSTPKPYSLVLLVVMGQNTSFSQYWGQRLSHWTALASRIASRELWRNICSGLQLPSRDSWANEASCLPLPSEDMDLSFSVSVNSVHVLRNSGLPQGNPIFERFECEDLYEDCLAWCSIAIG